jgi:hypothetical protein
MGMSWATGGDIQNGMCPENIKDLAYNSIYCGYAFFGLGCSAMFISMAISMCMGRREQNSGNGQGTSANQQQTKMGYVAFPSVANKV